MDEKLRSYLAGLLDGDGCFALSLTRRDFNKGICIAPQVRVALKGNDGHFLEKLQNETGIGRIYYSNKGKENCICSWQTVNTDDAILLAKLVYPYLLIKKEKAKKFIEIVKYYQSTSNPKGYARVKNKGKRLRKRSEMYKIIKEAVTLNFDRQTKRYRNHHGWDYWQPIINELYPDDES